MRILGSLTYEWRGGVRTALATGDLLGERIDVYPEWIAVSRPYRPSDIVEWEMVRGINGYLPVCLEDEVVARALRTS